MSDPAWIAVGPVDFALDVSRNPNMQKGKVLGRKLGGENVGEKFWENV